MVEVTEPTDEALLDGFQRAAFGYTELLEGFVSNKTRRKFKAYLAYDKKEDKVTFEFEPRAPRTPAAAKKAGPRRSPRPNRPETIRLPWP